MIGGTPRELRKSNRTHVLEEVLRKGTVSRTELADHTGLTGTAITRISRELIDLGLLEEGEKETRDGIPGRRRTALTLSSGGPYVIGLGFQTADRSLVLANLRGEILSEVRVPPSAAHDFPGYMDRLSMQVDQLVAEAGVSRNKIAGVGAAVAGIVDPIRGHVSRAPLLGWVDVPVYDLLSETLDMPIIVNNLNNTLCTAEFSFGLGQNNRNMMMFRVSYNTGAGFFVEGKLVHGFAYGAGQVSHMPITGGRVKCSCGARGCLNTVSSGLAVLSAYEKIPYAEVAEADPESNTKRLLEILERSESGDKWAIEVLRKSGSRFGRVLNGFAIAFQPEQILLAGQVGRNPHFTNGVKKAVENDVRPASLRPDRISVSSMTVAQSAVYLALSRFVFSERLDMQALKRNQQLQTRTPQRIAATR